MVENGMLVLSIRNGQLVVEIDISSSLQNVLSDILHKLNSKKLFKQSETSKILLLANITKNKIPDLSKYSNLANQLSKMIWDKSGSNKYIHKESKLFKTKIKIMIKKRMKKSLTNRIIYLGGVVQQFQSVDISAPLMAIRSKISECLNSMPKAK